MTQTWHSASALKPQGRGLSLRTAMRVSGVMLVIGLLAGMALIYEIIDSNRVGSDRYTAIVEGKDFIADVIPPPLLPYEATVAMHTLDAIDPAQVTCH